MVSAEARGEAVTMSDDDQLLTHRLRAHVTSLAEEIGERNVFNSEALRRAAAYIEAEWGALGYGVERLEYDVSGIRCANLIATREGSTRRNEILLLGAHYDSVVGSPGANDNASKPPGAQMPPPRARVSKLTTLPGSRRDNSTTQP